MPRKKRFFFHVRLFHSHRNIEHMVKQHQNTPQHGQNQVSDEVKFQVVGVHCIQSSCVVEKLCATLSNICNLFNIGIGESFKLRRRLCLRTTTVMLRVLCSFNCSWTTYSNRLTNRSAWQISLNCPAASSGGSRNPANRR